MDDNVIYIEKERSLKDDTIFLEYVLIKHFRPIFLNIERDDYDLQVVLSSTFFEHLHLERRIKLVYDVLVGNAPDILQNRLVTIQPFDSKEMIEAIDTLWKE